jgi:hypothetical protein
MTASKTSDKIKTIDELAKIIAGLKKKGEEGSPLPRGLRPPPPRPHQTLRSRPAGGRRPGRHPDQGPLRREGPWPPGLQPAPPGGDPGRDRVGRLRSGQPVADRGRNPEEAQAQRLCQGKRLRRPGPGPDRGNFQGGRSGQGGRGEDPLHRRDLLQLHGTA